MLSLSFLKNFIYIRFISQNYIKFLKLRHRQINFFLEKDTKKIFTAKFANGVRKEK